MYWGSVALGSGMRTANGSSDHSADTTEENRRNHTRPRMLVLVAFGSKSGSDAKADDCSDQSMAPVSRGWPHSARSARLRISDTAWNGIHGSTMGKL